MRTFLSLLALVFSLPLLAAPLIAPFVGQWEVARRDHFLIVSNLANSISSTGGITLTAATNVAVSVANSTLINSNALFVRGPASATDNAVARFDATTGKLVQNSGVTISDGNNISGVQTLSVSDIDITGQINQDTGTGTANLGETTTTGLTASNLTLVTLAGTGPNLHVTPGGVVSRTNIVGGAASTNLATLASGYSTLGGLRVTNTVIAQILDVVGIDITGAINQDTGTGTANLGETTATGLTVSGDVIGGRGIFGGLASTNEAYFKGPLQFAIQKLGNGTIDVAPSTGSNGYTFVTNANTTLTFSGTPDHGQQLWLRASNSATTNIVLVKSFFDPSYGSNVTGLTVVSSNLHIWLLEYNTNFVGGGAWYIVFENGPTLEPAAGNNVTFTTNGNTLTISASGGSGGGAQVTNVALLSGTSTNLIIDLGLASTNHVVFKVGMLTNSHVVLSNALLRKYPVEIVWQQDTVGVRSVLSLRSTDGLIQTNASLSLTTNANAMDIWALSASYFTSNVVVSAGESGGTLSTSTNLFVMGTRYTNNNRKAFVSASITLNAAAAGTAKVSLYVERVGVTNLITVAAGPLASLVTIEPLMQLVGPGEIYYFTDETSGTGATAALVANTSSKVDL